VVLLALGGPPGVVIAIAGLAYIATLATFECLVFPSDARLVRGFLLRRLAA